MQRTDFFYELPKECIAHTPTAERSASRLLQLNGESGTLTDGQFKDVLSHISPGDLVIFNDTRVIPARLFAKKESGGKLEILVERLLDRHHVLAHVRSSKSPKAGAKIVIDGGAQVTMVGRQGALFELRFDDSVIDVLEKDGHMPLPPYIEREDTAEDKERYQTVYSREDKKGAVAAPTAGLHFDEALLDAIRDKGADIDYVTLHVGAGTFQPVRVDDIHSHEMHAEWIDVSESVVEKVTATKTAGNKVVAVGTTSVRCLETAAQSGTLAPYQGDTQIFIYPGYTFNVVDALITNFHLPESTLVMLVSAFAGYHHTMNAYLHAVEQKYRFFSYGDAMYISKNPKGAAIAEEVKSK